MRLARRLDAIASRLPHDTTGGEEAINRIVFARYRHEMDAALAAAPPLDIDAYTREFERLIREEPHFWEDFQRDFAARWEEEEREQGPWMAVPAQGRIREKDYLRLRAQVTGGRDAAHDTP